MTPTVFVVMPFNEIYENLYAQVLHPSLTEMGFNITRADQILQSNVVLDDIAKSIRKANLVIVEATEWNPNVYLEFGIALSCQKEMVLLTHIAEKLPFDTRHIRHLVYDPVNLEETKNLFISWVKDTNAYKQRQNPAKKLFRGETFENIFDSTSCVVTSTRSIEQEILAEIRGNCMIPCFQSYNTDKGTIHWLRLSSDPLYKVFHESIEFLSSHGDELLQSMGDDFLNENPDYISLGPGNGQKDRVLLRTLFAGKDDQSEIFYYPIDVSRRMLSNTIECLLSDANIKDRIKIKTIHAEFAKLSDFRPVFDYRTARNLFVFLGNTLGNIRDELTFMQTLKSAMHTGDMLLLEVRRKTTTLELGGHDKDQNGLSFSPLSRLGVPYDSEKIYREEYNGLFSQITGTKTVTTRYREATIDDTKYKEICLSCVNYYDPEYLTEALCEKPLNFKLRKHLKTPLLLYYVLEKQ